MGVYNILLKYKEHDKGIGNNYDFKETFYYVDHLLFLHGNILKIQKTLFNLKPKYHPFVR